MSAHTTMAGFHLIICLALMASTVFLFSKDIIGYLFTNSPEVIHTVSTLVVILVAYQFGDALQITYANSLRGIGDVVSMAVISFIGYFLIAMPGLLYLWFCIPFRYSGNLARVSCRMTLTGIMMCIRYYRKLKRKYI